MPTLLEDHWTLQLAVLCLSALIFGCIASTTVEKTRPTMNEYGLIVDLLPIASAYTRQQEAYILEHGRPLTADETNIASSVGVRFPERVRVLNVDSIPLPEHESLRSLMIKHGLGSNQTVGRTMGYGIYLKRRSSTNVRLMRHELTHVAQYERFGGIERFLMEYMNQIFRFGYARAPLEMEARWRPGR